MRVILQRVKRANVQVEGKITGQIERGLLVLAGVAATDSEQDARVLAAKVAAIRIFPDANGKMNLNVAQASGALLVVSNFTLYADVSRGNRPSFEQAAPPELAELLYGKLLSYLRETGVPVQAGVFRAHMEIEMVADGPVTITLET